MCDVHISGSFFVHIFNRNVSILPMDVSILRSMLSKFLKRLVNLDRRLESLAEHYLKLQRNVKSMLLEVCSCTMIVLRLLHVYFWQSCVQVSGGQSGFLTGSQIGFLCHITASFPGFPEHDLVCEQCSCTSVLCPCYN